MEATAENAGSGLFVERHRLYEDAGLIRKAVEGGWNPSQSLKQLCLQRIHEHLSDQTTKATVVAALVRTVAQIDASDIKLQIASETRPAQIHRGDVHITNLSQTNVIGAGTASLWSDVDAIRAELSEAAEAEQADRTIPVDLENEREARKLAGLSADSHAPKQTGAEQAVNASTITSNGFSMPDRTDEPTQIEFKPYSKSSAGSGFGPAKSK